MLSLARKLGQSITLHTSDGPIVVKFCSMKGSITIVLGIEAPQSVRIVRDDAIKRQPTMAVGYRPGRDGEAVQ